MINNIVLVILGISYLYVIFFLIREIILKKMIKQHGDILASWHNRIIDVYLAYQKIGYIVVILLILSIWGVYLSEYLELPLGVHSLKILIYPGVILVISFIFHILCFKWYIKKSKKEAKKIMSTLKKEIKNEMNRTLKEAKGVLKN